MSNIYISNKLAKNVPNIKLSCINCNVRMELKNETLWNEIQSKIEELSNNLKVEDISKIPSISASRKAYKACGKDPARYRLSAFLKQLEEFSFDFSTSASDLKLLKSGGYSAVILFLLT